MTIKEFQHQYHDYSTKSDNEAIKEVQKLNDEKVIDKNGEVIRIIPVHLPGMGYYLMVHSAVEELRRIEII